MKDGELGKDNWSHARWCNTHKQYHGVLYVCPSYSANLKAELEKQGQDWANKLNDPYWVRQQEKAGIPPEVIAINRFFAGLD